MRRILITGGYGFIGSTLIRMWREEHPDDELLNLDFSEPQRVPDDLADAVTSLHVDLCDLTEVQRTIHRFQPDGIVNLAAQIDHDDPFHFPFSYFEGNMRGTYNLLAAYKEFVQDRTARFLQVSTVEVFGRQVQQPGQVIDEQAQMKPVTAYGISKAAADLMVNSYHRAFGLDTVICYAHNVFGARQGDQYFIPNVVHHLLRGLNPPFFGKQRQVADWLYVEDFCWGIMQAFELGRPGSSYCFSGHRARSGHEVALAVASSLERLRSSGDFVIAQPNLYQFLPPHSELIDDNSILVSHAKALDEWGWFPEVPFEIAVDETVRGLLEELN